MTYSRVPPNLLQSTYPGRLARYSQQHKRRSDAVINLGANIGDRLAIVGDISKKFMGTLIVKYDAEVLVELHR